MKDIDNEEVLKGTGAVVEVNSLEDFFQQKVKAVENKKIVASKRITDKQGNPREWEIKSITNKEDDALRRKNTTYIKTKSGATMPRIDTAKYNESMIVECVVFPDLRNVQLIESWGVSTAEELLNKILTPGEINELLKAVQDVNGWVVDFNELVDDIKN